jgi:hypothetical protein
MPKTFSRKPIGDYSLRNREVKSVVEFRVQTTSNDTHKRRRGISASPIPSSKPRRGRRRIVPETESDGSSETDESSESSDYHDPDQDKLEQEPQELMKEPEPERERESSKKTNKRSPHKKTSKPKPKKIADQVVSSIPTVGKKEIFF